MPQRELVIQEDEDIEAPRGAVAQLWETRDHEVIIAGPAETGKTWGCCNYLDALLWKYPGANGVMLRKTYSSLVASALQTYERIIAPPNGEKQVIKKYGGEKPEWFDYPNGSRLYVCGLDNAGKVLSTERDFFYVNQAEELTLGEWEYLVMRATGRGAVMPYTRVFGDCNPGPPSHWILNRETLRVWHSRHEDNPTLFDANGDITEQGKRSLSILDALTGVRKKRYRYGQWVQAEGVVYEEWDRAVHLIDPFPIPAGWRRFRVIDFGYTNPFVCQWWALSPDDELYLYREIYHSQRLVQDHCERIVKLSEGERIEVTIADHDAEDRATANRYGVRTIPAHKSVTPGIQAVQERLKVRPNGKPRLYVMRGALVETDSSLQAKRVPICTEQEFETYVWVPDQSGRPNKEEPLKVGDHGMDGTRYMVAYLDIRHKMKVY